MKAGALKLIVQKKCDDVFSIYKFCLQNNRCYDVALSGQ